MSGIHNLVLVKLQESLTAALITNIAADDSAIVGVVKIGPLQGEPDPDDARISLELYYNDPDQAIKFSGIGLSPEPWDDQVEEIEVGGSVTWKRRFTVKARALLERSREELTEAHQIASTLRSRIEKALLAIRFSDVSSDDEYVSRGIYSDHIRSEVVQAGGPPDAFDFLIKIRFEILTTEKVGV